MEFLAHTRVFAFIFSLSLIILFDSFFIAYLPCNFNFAILFMISM